MNGARALLSTLVDAGVDVCFANPGTSEMHFVAALDDVPAMRGVLCLFEGVVTGAADGYGRVAGRPAATLLHLGPGPRQRAGQPAQRPAGPDADRQHRGRPRDVPRPLRRAAPVGHRVHRRRRCRAGTARRRGPTTWPPTRADAVAAALGPPGCVATLVLPADASWSESATGPCPPRPRGRPSVVPADTVEEVAKALRGRRARGAAARRDARCGPTGCTRPAGWRRRPAPRCWARPSRPTSSGGRASRPWSGWPTWPRWPRPSSTASGTSSWSTPSPRSPSSPTPARRATWSRPGCTVHTLARPGEDAAGALEALAEAVGAPGDGGVPGAVGPARAPHRGPHAGVAGRRRRAPRCPRAPSSSTRATRRASSSRRRRRGRRATTG